MIETPIGLVDGVREEHHADTQTHGECKGSHSISDSSSARYEKVAIVENEARDQRVVASSDLALTAFSKDREQLPTQGTSSNAETLIIKIGGKLQNNGLIRASKVTLDSKVFSVLLVSENEQAKARSKIQKIASDDTLSVSASSLTGSDEDEDQYVDPSLYQNGTPDKTHNRPKILQAIAENPELLSKMAKKKKGFYNCSHCPTKFVSMLEFFEHMQENNISRPFRCTDVCCPWHYIGFEKRGHCRRHQRTQHGLSLSCSYISCEKTFSRTDSLARHIHRCHLNKKKRISSKTASHRATKLQSSNGCGTGEITPEEMMNSEDDFLVDQVTDLQDVMMSESHSSNSLAEVSVIDPDMLVAAALSTQ